MEGYLVFRSGQRLCGLPVQHVREVMRPQPVQPLPGLPTFVRGTCLIRGDAVPLVDLRAFLGDDHSQAPQRLLSLRAGPVRSFALCVDEVLGLRPIETRSSSAFPPLLTGVRDQCIEAIERLDSELVTVLRASHLIAEDVWAKISREDGP